MSKGDEDPRISGIGDGREAAQLKNLDYQGNF
jgi:hypothetical protein